MLYSTFPPRLSFIHYKFILLIVFITIIIFLRLTIHFITQFVFLNLNVKKLKREKLK